ncbi:DUF2851 family protein [Tamlana sp. 2_MG-2023]|uniref:DUF2851 family protein n=1 Tax=unclassified Tamlana TaxID=2614803 RepID=UPI0026E1725C|nr:MULTISPECIES: DUF2851 family protein [unclassified Tamlana]MDO6760178.1 DUF2851 family protein [Tamlana sp. 2_MG-2023]MDO6790124.1 DUF2851 family protein [Tamlana sp. 1_MG-2023]
MKEDFLHYIWKLKKFEIRNLKTTDGAPILIRTVGEHNFNSGPDFFNAKLKIDEQLWAGNVEIHVKSSDWYVHNHERDPAYDNVILHVVWEHDTEVFRKDQAVIPTLELKNYIKSEILNNYKSLFSKENTWINCENDFASIDDFTLSNWLERLFFERLERKSQVIENLLKDSKNDWEAVLFKMLAKNFGLKVNGDAFFSLAHSMDFSIIRKSQSCQNTLEALFFGQAGLLDQDVEDAYHLSLVKEYQFLKQKFKLTNSQVLPLQFFRLRPLNFPTIRLSQLASLYAEHHNLFSKVIALNDLNFFYELFHVETSAYWKTHYTFHKESKVSAKALSKAFIDLLLINTILPIKFLYAKQRGEDISSDLIDLAEKITSENNSIVKAFNGLKKISRSSIDSQALIQLKTNYCDTHSCLKCAVGNQLLSK